MEERWKQQISLEILPGFSYSIPTWKKCEIIQMKFLPTSELEKQRPSRSPRFSVLYIFLLWGTIQIRFTLCPTEEWETLEEPLKKLAWESIGAVLESFHSVFWNGALKITVVFLNIICNELSCALLKHVWILNCSYLEKQNVINSKRFFNVLFYENWILYSISVYIISFKLKLKIATLEDQKDVTIIGILKYLVSRELFSKIQMVY